MTIVVRKEDRRIQRTRALLRDALLALIVEKGYQDISIQDITDRADVARTTFYLHYSDKDDLLFSSMRDMYEELLSKMPLPTLDDIKNGTLADMATSTDYEHVAQYADFYRIMLGEKGSPVFMTRVRKLLADAYETKFILPLVKQGLTLRVPSGLLGYLIAGMQISSMIWWVNEGMKPSPEEMGYLTEQVCINGLLWAVGVTPES
jgi:AcrR family transcriptional regulator